MQEVCFGDDPRNRGKGKGDKEGKAANAGQVRDQGRQLGLSALVEGYSCSTSLHQSKGAPLSHGSSAPGQTMEAGSRPFVWKRVMREYELGTNSLNRHLLKE